MDYLGILKYSKCKEKISKKYFKNCTSENEAKYKDITNAFAAIKHKSKQNYYSDMPLKFKGDTKRARGKGVNKENNW